MTDASCVDHVVNGLLCPYIPSVCQQVYAALACPRYCGMCSKSGPSVHSL